MVADRPCSKIPRAMTMPAAFSDIDILIIYAGSPREDAYKTVWRCLRLRGLEPHVYAETEAEGLQPTLDRMTRDGITIL
jgi:hypothetical protein